MKASRSNAKAPNAKFAYSSPGNGSTPHLNASQLAHQAKIDMLHVPYKGVAPAVVDLAAGMVTATFASYSDLVPHVQSGRVRMGFRSCPSFVATMLSGAFPRSTQSAIASNHGAWSGPAPPAQ